MSSKQDAKLPKGKQNCKKHGILKKNTEFLWKTRQLSKNTENTASVFSWFSTVPSYYQLISCINWPLVPAENRGSPIPAACSEAAQKNRNPQGDRRKLPAQWVWKTAQLGGKTAELATLVGYSESDVDTRNNQSHQLKLKALGITCSDVSIAIFRIFEIEFIFIIIIAIHWQNTAVQQSGQRSICGQNWTLNGFVSGFLYY